VCWALTVARIGSLFWFLVALELDARFGQWWLWPVIVANLGQLSQALNTEQAPQALAHR
jgi:hypothetical protein